MKSVAGDCQTVSVAHDKIDIFIDDIGYTLFFSHYPLVLNLGCLFFAK
tara:strand:+ start:7537 stop:7680 length:144 start_codon:yes stop_codon:yes gene_type:complete